MKLKSFDHAMVIVLCFALIAPLAAEAAADGQTILLILDASGSMWGQIGGEPKISIAKQAMKTLVDTFPADAKVGLVLYGHRRKGDCDDVEVIIPPATLDKARLIAAVEAINPKGKTPLARSIRLAAEQLADLEGERTVILISDGRETCDPDACAATRKLKESGVKVVIHVIGFDVGDEERAELECIASAGGGKYYAAANADDLVLAAATASETVPQTPASGDGKLWLDDPAVFTAGTGFEVHFEAAETFHDNAWVGVVPSEIEHGDEDRNDANDLSYRYLMGKTSGTLSFIAPAKPGSYDLRMHDSDSNGREVASASFEVVAARGKVWMEKHEVLCGEEMEISFSAAAPLGDSAWIGLIPPEIPHGSAAENDDHDVAYRYVSGSSGTVTINAPSRPGRWTARLHDTGSSDGNEIAFADFTVTLAAGELRLSKTSFSPGETIVVSYTVPENLPSSAWIGLLPSEAPHVDESTNDDYDLSYRYVGDKPEGSMEFVAPDKPGRYDFRLNDTDDSGNEIAFLSFTVK